MSIEITAEKLVDLRMAALTIAERSVSQPYVPSGAISAGASYYRDKDIHEIIVRATRFLAYALDDSLPETQNGLIEKLRDILCSKKD